MAEKSEQISTSNVAPDPLRWRMLGQSEGLEIAAWIIEQLTKDVGAPSIKAENMADTYGKMLDMAESLAKGRPQVDQEEITRLKREVVALRNELEERG
jgi:hypothetical protein